MKLLLLEWQAATLNLLLHAKQRADQSLYISGTCSNYSLSLQLQAWRTRKEMNPICHMHQRPPNNRASKETLDRR
jgi:hypothetical protein